MAYKVTSQPSEEPISLSEAKNWLKVSGAADDAIITMLINAERQYIESKLNLKLVTQTITQKVDKFPTNSESILLEANPVQAITSLTYKDSAGAVQTLSASNYILDNSSTRARIYLKDGQEWPTTSIDEKEIVTITYTAGYGAASAVPGKLAKLVYHAVGFAYENRMNPVEAKRTYLDRIINHERLWYFE